MNTEKISERIAQDRLKNHDALLLLTYFAEELGRLHDQIGIMDDESPAREPLTNRARKYIGNIGKIARTFSPAYLKILNHRSVFDVFTKERSPEDMDDSAIMNAIGLLSAQNTQLNRLLSSGFSRQFKSLPKSEYHGEILQMFTRYLRFLEPVGIGAVAVSVSDLHVSPPLDTGIEIKKPTADIKKWMQDLYPELADDLDRMDTSLLDSILTNVENSIRNSQRLFPHRISRTHLDSVLFTSILHAIHKEDR